MIETTSGEREREGKEEDGNAALFFSLLPPLLIITHSAAIPCCFAQTAVPHPVSSLPLLFFVLRGSSAVIHRCQAAIPYKAGGSPHLASYFPIRSAVTDRLFAGSGLECKPACLPQA